MHLDDDKKRILLVGENPLLKRQMDDMARQASLLWEFSTAPTPAVALKILGDQPFDGFVLEASEEDIRTGEFFTTLARQNPQAIGYLCCHPKEIEGYQRSVGGRIYYLSNQWDSEGTESAMRRAFLLVQLERSAPLRVLAQRIGETPRLPQLYSDILRQLESPDSDLERIAQLLSTDPATCATLLKGANSALYGLAQPTTNVFDAVMTLGLEQTKAIVLYSQFLTQLNAAACQAFSVDDMWYHALQTASFARWITKEETRVQRSVDAAYTAGLLHDLGKFILAANLPSEFGAIIAQARAQGKPPGEVEQETFGTTHAELGALLMARWELPFPIVEAIAWHHAPLNSKSKVFDSLTAVHVANVFAHELDSGQTKQKPPKVDSLYLVSVSKFNRLRPWRTTCGIPQAEIPARLETL